MTFLHREIGALRAHGVVIETFSVWRPAPSDIADESERESTFYLLPVPAHRVLTAHAALFADSPLRYLRSLRLARRTAPPGGRIVQWRRFIAAGILAHQVLARRLAHIHNDGTDESCTVAMLAASLGGLHFSFTVHGPWIFTVPKDRHFDEKLRRAVFVRCISYFTRSQCMIWAPTGRWAYLHVIHCGLDPERYTVREHAGEGLHLLFVARLALEKGLPILIDAFARLRERRSRIRLTIVGAGQEQVDIEARAGTLGLGDHVRFTGYQTPEQVAEWLRAADVLVLPSLIEGVPIAAMEAMASGVPVVATRVGGLSELVEDGVSGYLVPAAAPVALAERIESLLDDPELRNRFGRAGRAKVVRDFNLARETVRLRDLFQWAVEGDPRSPWRGNDDREALRR